MARVKLDLPNEFLYETNIQVRIGDINYGGHLGNDAVLSLVHEARVRFLNHYGFSEMDVDGAGIIMVDTAIIYEAEGFYGDDVNVRVAVGDFSRMGCDVFYLLTKNNGEKLARAKTGIVFFDYDKRRVTSMPTKFKELFVKSSI